GPCRVPEPLADDRSVASNVQALISHLVGRDVRVLLFGGAVAEITETLAKRGCDVVAVAYDGSSAAVAAAFAARVVLADPNTVDYLNGLDGAFDVAVFVDFLEYTRSPRQVLSAAARLLGPRG